MLILIKICEWNAELETLWTILVNGRLVFAYLTNYCFTYSLQVYYVVHRIHFCALVVFIGKNKLAHNIAVLLSFVRESLLIGECQSEIKKVSLKKWTCVSFLLSTSGAPSCLLRQGLGTWHTPSLLAFLLLLVLGIELRSLCLLGNSTFKMESSPHPLNRDLMMRSVSVGLWKPWPYWKKIHFAWEAQGSYWL